MTAIGRLLYQDRRFGRAARIVLAPLRLRDAPCGRLHYRNSTEVGAAMGRRVGEPVVKSFPKPTHSGVRRSARGLFPEVLSHLAGRVAYGLEGRHQLFARHSQATLPIAQLALLPGVDQVILRYPALSRIVCHARSPGGNYNAFAGAACPHLGCEEQAYRLAAESSVRYRTLEIYKRDAAAGTRRSRSTGVFHSDSLSSKSDWPANQASVSFTFTPSASSSETTARASSSTLGEIFVPLSLWPSERGCRTKTRHAMGFPV